jgi:hypothetical protein
MPQSRRRKKKVLAPKTEALTAEQRQLLEAFVQACPDTPPAGRTDRDVRLLRDQA